MTRTLRWLAALLLLAAVAGEATGSDTAFAFLPRSYGGELSLPAPEPITSLDPLEARTPFQHTLARAVGTPLYRLERGRLRPVLAADVPTRQGRTLRIPILEGVMRHGRVPLSARAIAGSLQRAADHPRTSWLFAGVEGGSRGISAEEGEVVLRWDRPARPGDGRRLVATPLAIVGGATARTPLGTGPFRGRLAGGQITLNAFSRAAEGAPFLQRIVFLPPGARDEELRDFELERLDGSWRGESLYGRRPTRPVTTRRVTGAAVLLVPSPALPEPAWSFIAGAIERRRFRRAGIEPRSDLARGLPEPSQIRVGSAPGRRIRILVTQGDPFEETLGEVLAAMLDERGVRVRVAPIPVIRVRDEVAQGQSWDVRFGTVVSPLPSPGGLVGAALVEAGQAPLATGGVERGLLRDGEVARDLAPRLRALVLGRRTMSFSSRADLHVVSTGPLLDLAEWTLDRRTLGRLPGAP